jgi:hypothetical protein
MESIGGVQSSVVVSPAAAFFPHAETKPIFKGALAAPPESGMEPLVSEI